MDKKKRTRTSRRSNSMAIKMKDLLLQDKMLECEVGHWRINNYFSKIISSPACRTSWHLLFDNTNSSPPIMAAFATSNSVQSPTVGEPDFSLSNVPEQDESNNAESPNFREKEQDPSQPMRVYTRTQLLLLSRSPLVKPPANMPELKDWFG